MRVALLCSSDHSCCRVLAFSQVLVVNGVHEIGQSKSIERYLSKRLGMLGANDVEAAQIDAFTEHIRDLKDSYNKAKATTGEEARKEAIASFFDRTMPDLLQKMEAAVAPVSAAKGGALIGKTLSLADVTLFYLITEYFDNKTAARDAMRGCTRLSASVEAVGSHPAIIKYLEKRPITAV